MDDCSNKDDQALKTQPLEDFSEFLLRCQGLSFILNVARPEQIIAIGPHTPAAIELLYAARMRAKFKKPFPESQSLEACGEDAVPMSRVAAAVEARVEELYRRECEFVLMWHVDGQEDVHVDGNLDVCDDSPDGFLVNEVLDYVRCH